MPTGARTGRRKRIAVPVAVAVAVAVHVLVLGGAEALDLSIVAAPFGHVNVRPRPVKPEPRLAEDCPFDVLLATGARAVNCLAPWHDPDACLDRLPDDFRIDLSGCLGRPQDAAPIAMITPRQAAKLEPIDPEPLLEMMKQPPKQPPPPQLPEPQKKQPPPPPAQARRQPMQVVETVRPDQEQAPDNARFLSEYNTRVAKQTVARGTPKEPMIAKSKPAELTPTEHPKEASVQQHPDKPPGRVGAPDVPGSLSMRQPGATSPAELQQEAKTRGAQDGLSAPVAMDGYAARRGDGEIEQLQHAHTETPQGQGGAGGGAPDVPNLKPSQDQLQRALGGGNVDHMEDVEEGDETALNSKRWIFASFFNRLKRAVAQNWDPATVWRRIDPTGQVNGFKTRVTEVRVTLSQSGELQKIVVTAPSGVTDLDDEAVRAFHAASPFPNPPRELVGADGSITFGFSFYFEIGEPHTAWHLFQPM